MSMAFVDREPGKEEIDHLRQLLAEYSRMPLPSPLFPVHSHLIEAVIEAFGISRDVLCTHANGLAGRKSPYKIVLNPTSLDDAAKKIKYPFAAYWEYLSRFNIDMQNYREYPAGVGAASVELLYNSDGQLDLSKSSFLYLHVGENRGRLSQYSYFVDPQQLQWHFQDASNEYSFFKLNVDDFDFLYGDDNGTVVYRILINKSAISRSFNELKEPGKGKKRKGAYIPTIPIEYFLSQRRRVWCSDVFQIEPLSTSQIAQFHVAAARAQKEAALAQLEEYIRTDPEEREFQKLLSENKWLFGHEYSEFLDKRELVIDSQQDFVGRRATDGFWDIVEIKRSLHGKNLFKEDTAHNNSLYPGVELSKAIGQVIHYIDRIDSRHDSILIDRGIDTNKVRVKLIIGRDGDERQVSALHNLNSHLNRIEIRTYDQLLRGARNHLADY